MEWSKENVCQFIELYHEKNKYILLSNTIIISFPNLKLRKQMQQLQRHYRSTFCPSRKVKF